MDEDRKDGEPLPPALVTVEDLQMQPRSPATAQQLGPPWSWRPPAEHHVELRGLEGTPALAPPAPVTEPHHRQVTAAVCGHRHLITRKLRDPATGQIVEGTVEDRTMPDWRANARCPKRQHREHYSKDAVPTVEITGLGGPADADEQPDPVELAARLDHSLFAVVHPPQLDR